MTDASHSNDRAGWELIWRGESIPPRYGSMSPPNASVVEWADSLPAGGFVLDIGCGVGRHCVYLGGRGFKMAGTDISPTGIKKAQEVCAEQKISFDGRVSDMTTLPWEDSNFDGALSTSTIHHHLRPDILKSLAEVRRVLKPGGLFLVDFPTTGRGDYQELKKQAASGEISEPEPDTFIDNRPYSDDVDGFLPHHFSDEADVRDLLNSFEILKLWVDGPEDPNSATQRSKWVAFVRKPLTG